MRPLSGPHLFFRRARVLVNGMVAEDIQDYNRTHELCLSMIPDHVRDNIDCEGHHNKHEHTWSLNSMLGIEGTKNRQ